MNYSQKELPSNPILIVDDNSNNLKVISQALKSAGWIVAIAKNGETALKQIKHTQPALILLDVMMPGIDGFETCRRLQADPETRHIPVIFMTALASTEDKLKGFEVGGVDYITKPIQHEEILARVKTHLQIYELNRQLEGKNQLLREQKQALQEAQKLAHVGNWEWDLTTNKLYWSDEIYRVFGWEKEPPETLFEKHKKQIYPEDFQLWQRALELLQEKGLPYDFDFRIIRPDGELRYIYAKGQAAKNDLGQVIKVFGTAQDISDRKLAEEALKQKATELEKTLQQLRQTQNQLVESEKMAALGGLVAGVAHEINTPLGLGVTAASLLADKITDFVEIYKTGQVKRSDLENFLNNIMQNSSMILANLNRAGDLIASFKQVAVDQTSEAQRSFKIKEYLEETLLSLRSSLKKTNHHIEINGDAHLEVNSYPGACSQIITNLVINSLVHGYQDLEAGKLTFNFYQEGEIVMFEYADDGAGIAPENLTKIFEPFFTTKRNQGGSGLGLHIVYNLVTQKLQGTIKCESQLGAGTKFSIEFPMEVKN